MVGNIARQRTQVDNHEGGDGTRAGNGHVGRSMIRLRLIACAVVMFACNKGATHVHLQVIADSSWDLDHYQLQVGTVATTAAPLPALDVQLPDDISAGVQTIEVWGLVAGDQVAYGSVAVTPVSHQTVPATVVLAALSCGLFCTDGETECGSDGLSTTTCMQQSDGCLAWTTPTSCPSDTPYCNDGACAAQCTDECAAGQTECDTAFGVQTCVQTTGDSCWHWSASVACESGQTCTNGTCGTAASCSQDGASCSDGDPCTIDEACTNGVCSGTPKCTAAPANAEPTCAADGTCGFTCDAGYMVSGSSCVCASGSATFALTDAPQMFTPPACVTSITVDVRGAAGGGGHGTGTVGLGGRTQATLSITAGEVLYIYVGGAGASASSGGTAGYNGGAAGGSSTVAYGGGGGGASDIRIGGMALSNRVIVGGGGGGAGYCNGGDGGNGGGLAGGPGSVGCTADDPADTMAGGGTQTAGGAAGTAPESGSGAIEAADAGQAGLGGSGLVGGGGGGGGLFGGGGAAGDGGGGGAGFASATATNVIMTAGFQAGDGQVIITWGAP